VFDPVLLSGKLWEKFSALTQRFADAGSNLSAGAKDGFVSGILIGMLIGLVWTPCAGPILAAILVQVIRQQSDALAFLEVAAFAFGAGLPMLIIALTGRQIMSKLRFFATHTETMRKAFGVIILLAVGFIASGVDPQSLFANRAMASASQPSGLIDGLKQPYDAREFAGLGRLAEFGTADDGFAQGQSRAGRVLDILLY
jgi:thiol:disulfide interchange protein